MAISTGQYNDKGIRRDYTNATIDVGGYQVTYSQKNGSSNQLTIKSPTGQDITPPQMANGSNGTVVLPNGAIVNVTGSGGNAHFNVVDGNNFQYMDFNGSGKGHNTQAMSGTAAQFFSNEARSDIAGNVFTTDGDSNSDTVAWLKQYAQS